MGSDNGLISSRQGAASQANEELIINHHNTSHVHRCILEVDGALNRLPSGLAGPESWRNQHKNLISGSCTGSRLDRLPAVELNKHAQPRCCPTLGLPEAFVKITISAFGDGGWLQLLWSLKVRWVFNKLISSF